MITVNMTKARDIHRDKVREARDPKLAAKDIDFQRALESGADTSAIVAEKQALRDAPAAAAISAATNVDELKAAWDTDLLGLSPYLP
jgi:predicted nucleotidyltransferase